MLHAGETLRLLTEHEVEFVVIGGLAMITHGSAHVTEDLDICYARTDANLSRLSSALAPLSPSLRGAPPGLPFRLDASTLRSGLNFTLDTTLGPLDLLGEVQGIGQYPEVAAASDLHEIFGLPIRVLSLDGLIRAKRATGRLKDQAHLLELEEIKRLLERE